MIDVFRKYINKDVYIKCGKRYANRFIGRFLLEKDLGDLCSTKKGHSLSRDLFLCAMVYNTEMGYSLKNHAIDLFLKDIEKVLSQIFDDLENLKN